MIELTKPVANYLFGVMVEGEGNPDLNRSIDPLIWESDPYIDVFEYQHCQRTRIDLEELEKREFYIKGMARNIYLSSHKDEYHCGTYRWLLKSLFAAKDHYDVFLIKITILGPFSPFKLFLAFQEK